MIHAHIDREKTVPLWAAVGAPLVGVPLMVALLALATPAATVPTGEPDAGAKTEQVEVQTVDQMLDARADCEEQPLKRG